MHRQHSRRILLKYIYGIYREIHFYDKTDKGYRLYLVSAYISNKKETSRVLNANALSGTSKTRVAYVSIAKVS